MSCNPKKNDNNRFWLTQKRLLSISRIQSIATDLEKIHVLHQRVIIIIIIIVVVVVVVIVIIIVIIVIIIIVIIIIVIVIIITIIIRIIDLPNSIDRNRFRSL